MTAAEDRRREALVTAIEADLNGTEQELRRLATRRATLVPLLRRARYGDGDSEVIEAMLRRAGIELPTRPT